MRMLEGGSGGSNMDDEGSDPKERLGRRAGRGEQLKPTGSGGDGGELE
ncbi:hypothetical protein An13g00530 [Aspergillus niger]|uniref:Uncharacterized protein n=2 Tax=Aspergillus niger TaxID=5061 RepID=A2R1A4_ASPNC|nr:hypothetical protein An13g00530 [Aspergillus niger]CAK41454.1 hypothetical protein An13g00530 [Aspergillus niger]